MQAEGYLTEVERALADLVAGFCRLPDLYLHEGDLFADLYRRLVGRPALSESHVTRDGRRTGLVHLAYPALLAEGLRQREERYPLAILNPAFIRARDLATVAQTDAERLAAYRALPGPERVSPLICAIDVHLYDRLTEGRLQVLREGMACLVEAADDAPRRYLAILFRNWQRDGQRRRLLDTLEGWAGQHPDLAVVYVQSYLDDVGRVYGGRYLNHWLHRAPLLPLDAADEGARDPRAGP